MENISLGYLQKKRCSINGQYFLGNGYRGFNPVIKQFNSQDDDSPFGNGGTHGYTYCNGDSINLTDSSGHGPLIDFFMLVFFGTVRNTRRAAEIGLNEVLTTTHDITAVSKEIVMVEDASVASTSVAGVTNEIFVGSERAGMYMSEELAIAEGREIVHERARVSHNLLRLSPGMTVHAKLKPMRRGFKFASRVLNSAGRAMPKNPDPEKIRRTLNKIENELMNKYHRNGQHLGLPPYEYLHDTNAFSPSYASIERINPTIEEEIIEEITHL